MIKKLICAAALLMVAGLQHTRAQYVYGTTGLLHAPSADMQRDKTFLCGFSYLQVAATPKHWNYDTWNYYINITLFPWLEVGYTCTLHKIGLPQYGYSYKFRNPQIRYRRLSHQQPVHLSGTYEYGALPRYILLSDIRHLSDLRSR